MKRIIIFILSLSIHVTIVCGQQLRLPRFFSDGMVVQRDSKIPVWGKSAPGDNVLVSLNGKKSQSKADTEGKWKVYLPKQKAGGPYVLSISNGREQVEIKNVLVGDVFLCSGQSNMELPIRRCTAGKDATLSVEEWLALFRDAREVVTDSFHGSVIARLLDKKCTTLCNEQRGKTRFDELNRLGTDLEALRQKGLSFLRDALSHNNE